MAPIQIVQTLEGHTSDVMACDFYDDLLATCSGDKSVKVWIREDNGQFVEAPFSPLMGHSYAVNCVRFSPFGSLLVSCSTDGKAIFWHTQDGENQGEVEHPCGTSIRVCAFAPSATILATASDNGTIVLWDIVTRTENRSLEGHESMITCAAFTPDSQCLITCSTAGDMRVWDGANGHGKYLAIASQAHDLGVQCCDCSPRYEGISEYGFLSGHYTIATCGNDDLVKIWSVKTNSARSITLLRTLVGHSADVMTCRFSTDGNLLASAGGDRTVIIWNPATGQVVDQLEGHNRYVICCAFSKSGLLVTGSNDKVVVVWNLGNNVSNAAETYAYLTINNSTKKGFATWSVAEVIKWLKTQKLEGLVEIFQSNGIDGKELMHLNHENLLTAMKIDSWGLRCKILRGIRCLRNPLWEHVMPESEDATLSEFCCPITQEVMRCPVIAADGYSYEKMAIEEWFRNGRETSPMTNETLPHKFLIPNHILVQLIQKYK